ncbi:MAG: hypothetical protein UX35_C0006G0011 [Microgenomates group bacterium GW2011_GWA1_46_15]|nr:MAG: hypothetical protein UX35_C0006G0011 [Microgenomates group bacterium GW2011_GWA1_46_15]
MKHSSHNNNNLLFTGKCVVFVDAVLVIKQHRSDIMVQHFMLKNNKASLECSTKSVLLLSQNQ